MFVYFVSYATKNGFGHCDVTLREPITSGAQVIAMGESIEEKAPELGVVSILNFVKLREEGESE